MLGTIFIDSRQASKFNNSTRGVIDFLEVVEETDSSITLKLKTVFSLMEEWVPCRNWSESVNIEKKELAKYIKQERFVSGAVWVPLINNYSDLVEMLNENKMSSIDIDKELSSQIYESDISNVNAILSKIGKFL